MPPAIAAIAPIIAAIGGAATAGLAIDQAVSGGPSAPALPKTPTAAPPLTTQQQQQVQGAVSGQLPDLQAQLGGAAAPDYLLSLAQVLGGTGGTPGTSGIAQQAVNQFLGTGTAPTASFTPSGTNPTPGSNLVGDQLANLTSTSFLG